MAISLLTFVLCAVAAWALTAQVRGYALARAIVDVPNDRSSHVGVTPRGGGLAITAVLLLGMSFLAAIGAIGRDVFFGFGIGAIVVATVGWLEDSRGVSPMIRIAIHLSVAAWSVLWFGAPNGLEVGGRMLLPFGALSPLFGVAWIAWSINFYNFMDGIDGLAAGHAVLIGVVSGALLMAAGAADLALVAFLVAGGSAGFLIWNWHPARIFMGDVGSGLLGYIFGSLAIAADSVKAVPMIVWVLVFGVFLFDATATLWRRALQGERWYAAHRSHAYQRAVFAGATHSQVTARVLLLTLIISLLGVLAWFEPRGTIPAVVAAFLLLLTAYLHVERLQPMWTEAGRS